MDENLRQIYDKLVQSGSKGSYEQFVEYFNANDNNKRSVYEKLVKAGSKGTYEQFMDYVGQSPKRMTVDDVENQNSQSVVTFDKNTTSFDDWYQTVPADRNDTTNYNLRRAYELAPAEELEAWRTATPEELENGQKHLRSVYFNENGEGEFMKSKYHPTIQMELDEYEHNEDFRKRYGIDTNGTYYKYVSRGLDLDDMSMDNAAKNVQLLESVEKEISSMNLSRASDIIYGGEFNEVKYNDLLYQQAILSDYVSRLKGSEEYKRGVQEIHSFNDQFREENNLVRGDAMSKLRKHNWNLFGASGNMFMMEKFMHMSNIDMNMLAPGQEDMYNDAAADFAIYGAEQKVRLAEDELANGTGGFGTQFARGWRNSNWNKLDKQMTLNMALQAYKIAKKFDENGELFEGQTLSESETRLFKALQIAYLADNTVVETMWERIGENAPEQVKYTLEFILTSELMGASALSKGIAGAATRNIEGQVAKKLVYKAVDYTAQPLLQTLYNPLNWMEGSIERQTGNLTYDENTGNFVFAGAQNEWDATRNAIVSAWIENFSEKIGEDIFKPAKYGNKYLRNMDNAFGRTYNQFATKIDIAIENAGLNKLDDVLKISKDIRLATGVQGIPGEYVEEVVGGIMDAMFVGDQSFHQYDENGNPNPNYLWNSEQQLETFLSCAVMSVGMTTVSNVRNGAVTAADRRKAKSYLNQMAKAMENQNIDTESIDKAFENGTINDVSDIVFKMGSAEDMTDDKRQILANYVAAKINYAAMRNADMSAIEDSFSEIEKEAYASVNAETKDAGGAGGRIIQANVEVNGETFEGVPIVSGRVLTRIETDENGNDYMVIDTRGSNSVLYIRVPGEEKARPIYSSNVTNIVAATPVEQYIETQKNELTGMMTELFGTQYDGGLPLEQLIAECAVLSDKEVQIGTIAVQQLEKGRKYNIVNPSTGELTEAEYVEDTENKSHVFSINGENVEMDDNKLKESMLRYRLALAEEAGVQDEVAQIELDALMREDEADQATRPVSDEQLVETAVANQVSKDESGNYTPDSNPRAVAVDILSRCDYDAEKARLVIANTVNELAAKAGEQEASAPSIDENIANAVNNDAEYNNALIAMYGQVMTEIDLYVQNFVGEPEIGETYTLTNETGTVYGRFEGYDANGNVQYRETDESGENDGRLVVLPKNEFQKQRRTHNIEIQAQKPITIENVQEIAEETPVIPTETITENAEESAVVPPVEETPVKEEVKLPRDKENNIDYKQITDPALYAKGLTEEFGNDAQSVIDELIADEKKNLEKAGTKNAIERRRAQKAAQSSIDFYNQVKNTLAPKPSDDVKAKNVAPKDSKAFEKRIAQAINEIGEPTSFDDEVLRRLANSSHQFKWGSDGTHKGMGAMLGFKGGGSEMISRASFLSKNGKYFDEVALDIWNDLPDAYHEKYTDQEVRDLMIDFLRSYSNPFEMVDAIRQMQLGARNGETIDEAADRQQEESLESIAASYGMTVDEFNEAVYKANELNMSLDEYLAINYAKEEFIKEIALTDEQYENYTNFAAEQILAEEQGEQYDTGRTESDTELHQGETETAQQGGIRTVVGESTGTGRERGNIGEEGEVQQERNQHGGDELPDQGVAAEPYQPRSQRGKDRAVELDKAISAQRERVASARSEYDKAVSDFNKRNGLFGDTADNDDSLFGDLADFSKENFERISAEKQTKIENEQKRLDEIVAQRDNELREIDEAEDKQSALEFAEQEVDTNPTVAQKEAGNYKKGHVTIDGFDISIENPRGSIRSGVDENGNEWSVTMHDTYGYIRNTESVDGDHIDIFLSDHIGNWNGSVFVVDQVKPDGSFDEHKVMYGFDTEDEAREAYLANYSEGWQGLGNITEVSKRGFKKWIESSHRKTKPFAEYKEILLSHQKEESKRVFKEDEKDRRLEALRRRHGSQLNININPQDLEDLLYVAGYHIENGVRKFADFCKGMITDLGDWVRPYLKQIYSACKYDEDIAKLNVPFEEWTEDREVSTFDVANFDKETADLAQTVEMVENEKKAEENINEINTQNEQTAANTEAIVGKAEALADQAESDVENITTEQQGNEIADNIDKAIDKINDQLALLGYYEADASDESQFHESYGYMKTAEKKAVKDMERLARQIAKDLGINVGRKQLAKANIAPAGGDVRFTLPLTGEKELVLWIDVYSDGINQRGYYNDNLKMEYGVFRIEDKSKSGYNQYLSSNIRFDSTDTYDSLIEHIKNQIRFYDQEFYDQMQEKLAAEEKAKESENKKKKTSKQPKKDLSLQISLFGEQNNNELNQDNNGQQRTDELRTEGLPAESVRHEQGSTAEPEAAGERAEEEAARPDTDRGREGSESDRSLQSGLRELKNQNNNHAERGTDYAPKSVDARIEANIKAIELMQQLIDTGEQATPEQMAVLRQFSGWGGLGKAFSESSYGWSPNSANARLKELLGVEAYEQANMSRNSAYYTPASVIDTLWDIAKALGFKGGNILEGSAGIGNILGLMPSQISGNSNIHAVEIDQTAGNILSLLYPDANVEVQGFEATKIENGSIDLAITNVPFVTGLRVNDTTGDKDLSKKFHDIHDFCIAKNIRKLRDGGIGIFITSNGTLDNSARLREWIVSEGNADVVGAFRLNNETFGGTGATSDIIVVRKRINGVKSKNAIDVSEISGERVAEYNTGETKKVKGEYVPVVKQMSMDYNSYFIAHPEMMAGKMFFGFEKGETYRETSKALYPEDGMNQNDMLANWVKSFESMDWSDAQRATTETVTENVYESLGDNIKEGSMLVNKKGVLCVAQRGSAVPLEVNANKVKGHTKVECFNSYQSIKQALADVLDYQTQNDDDSGLQPLLDKLNRTFDSFIRTYGNLHKNTSITFLKNDVDYPNVLALETFRETADVNGNKIPVYGKTDVFTRRVVEKDKAPEPTNIKDGIIASIYLHGRVDIPYLSKQLNMSEDEVKNEIINQGLGFENPSSREIEVSYEYLSGNVREKLEQAIENNIDGRYDNNIKELEKVIPMTIPSHLIDFSIGSSWIEPQLYVDYIKDRTDISVEVAGAGGSWFIKTPYFVNEQKNRTFGVFSKQLNKLIYGTQLIDAAMNNRTITVSETHKKYDGSTETIIDKEATQACANKIDEIRQDFKDWAKAKMQTDNDMSQRIERVYNDMFNNYVPKEIPDDFIPQYFGGATHNIQLRKHQAKAVIRATTQPLLLAHEVGTGKTFTLISTAMEMRRLGTAKKPMIVVQNATVGQFVESAKQLYPNAKVLTIEDKDHTGEGRRNFYAKIKYNDWDMIVVPQSVFERIPDSDERQMAFVQDKIEEKLLVLEQMRDADADGNSMIVKQAERELSQLEDQKADIAAAIQERRKKRDEKREAVTKQNTEVKALEMLDRATDDVENFDDMGIDAILVDEAHEYKHLGFATAMQRGVKGVDPSYSKKAQGVFLKAQAVLEKNNGRNVVFATGTPISNTAAEIWTFMRYLMPADTMKNYGIYYFDDFVRNFGNLQQMLEFTTSGKFKENNRFAGYVNLPELVRIWSGVADTVLTRDAGGVNDKIPDMEGGKAQDIYLPQTKALRSVMKFVKAQLEKFEQMTGKQKKENSHIPLVMYGIAKAAAVDARLVVDEAEDDPNSKTNEAVRQILRSLDETKSYKGTVAVFADNYQNKHSKFNIYEDIKAKLVEAGIPENQIVIMKSGMSVKKKLEIFDKMNSGEVRVMMGSTFTLGTGVNIQERLHTLIHLDAPNRPMDYTQRNGRILRQGNLHKQMGKPVRVLRFGVEDSLDVTAYQRLKTKGAIADSIMNGKNMMINNMENRVLEEEEDVFGDTVAQLSGSEYAMLKNQAEKDVIKYEAKYKQWQADQIYVRNELPNVKTRIEYNKKAIADAKKALDIVKKAYNGNLDITIGKLKFNSIDGMKDFITEYNKSIMAAENEVKNANGGEQTRSLTININGIDFVVNTTVKYEMLQKGTTLSYVARRNMRYSCAQLGLEDIPVKQSLVRNAIDDIVYNIMTGNEFESDIQSDQAHLDRYEKSYEQLKQRDGKEFEFTAELEASRKRLEEYTAKMKEEMEEKEKKYAAIDAEVEAAENIIEAEEAEENESEETERLSVEENSETTDETNESQEIAFNAVKDSLAKAGIEVVEATERDIQDLMSRNRGIKDSNGKLMGWVGADGKIYLTKEGMNAKTAIHEYTHLWAEALQMNNPELWNKIKDMLRDTPIWNEVVSSSAYENIKDNDDEIAGEALSRISGKANAKRMEDTARRIMDANPGVEGAAQAATLLGKLRDALNKFWTWVGKKLFGINKISVADMILADLVNGVNPINPNGGKEKTAGEQTKVTESLQPIEAAKIQRISDNLSEIAKKIISSDNAKGFITALSTALEAEVKGASRYANFTLSDGTTLSIRISNHNENANNYIEKGTVRDSNISIVVKQRRRGNSFVSNEDVPLMEFSYLKNNLTGEDMSNIATSLADALQNGVYEDRTGKAKVNISGTQSKERLSVEAQTEFETHDMNTAIVSDILNNKLGIDSSDMRRKTIKRRLVDAKRKWMDSLDPLKKLQQSIAEATGKPLADFEDAYNAELRRASISLPMIERYTDDYLLPMIESVGDILKEGVDEKTLGLYLIAKHGLERNEYFKKLNDWKEVQDMSGLTALAAELDRGDEDFTQVAKDFVNEIENTVPKNMLDNMWSRINNTTNAILAKYLESGLISKKQYDDYRKRYNNYVPLRGWDETTSDEFYNYSVLDPHFQSAIKQAKGRTSLANNVLANIMNMTESAIVIGEKNKVLQRLFNLAQGRKSDVLKTQRSWYVKNQQGEWEETLPIITEDMTPEQVKSIVEQFEQNMERMSALGEAKQSLNRADVGVKIKPFNVHEHYVPVFVNGRKHAIIINADPTIVKSLTDSNELANTKFVSALRNTTRFMSQLNTTFNPEFIVKNVLRDAGMAMISSYIEGGMKYANKVRSNINKFGYRYLGQLIRNGECDNTEITQYWKEFIENGGETGFTRTLNVDEQAKRLKKLYKKMLSGKDIDQKGMFETITSAIDSFNRWGEDLSRFAVFVTNRQLGKTVEQSVNMAKNATINFQRKGGGTLAAWFRTTRSFFNAGMQALYRFGSLAKNNPKRFAIASTAMVISGLLVPALNIMMLSLMGGDDDDWNAYRFMSEFTGNHSWHMFVGDGFITIPYPQEFAALFAAGNIVFRHAIGWADNNSTIAGDIANMALEQLPFDMGGGGSIDWKIMNAVTPQVLQPFVEVYINEDFMGRPIYKKNPFNENDPAWTKAYKSTSGTLVELAKRLNGNDPVMKHSKYFDWLDNPAAWQHIITGEAGGIGRIVSNVSRLVENGYTADNMPFLRNIYMTDDMSKYAPQVSRDYYNILNGFDEMKNNINGYENDGESLYDNLERYMKLKTSPEYKAYLATKDLTKTIKEKQDSLKLMQAYDFSDEDILQMRLTITSLQIMVLDITNNMIIDEGRPMTKEFRQVIDNIKKGEEE